jgi:hypothetical protein
MHRGSTLSSGYARWGEELVNGEYTGSRLWKRGGAPGLAIGLRQRRRKDGRKESKGAAATMAGSPRRWRGLLGGNRELMVAGI